MRFRSLGACAYMTTAFYFTDFLTPSHSVSHIEISRFCSICLLFMDIPSQASTDVLCACLLWGKSLEINVDLIPAAAASWGYRLMNGVSTRANGIDYIRRGGLTAFPVTPNNILVIFFEPLVKR